jgi:hypothetical protein
MRAPIPSSQVRGGGVQNLPEHLNYSDDLVTGIDKLKKKAKTTISDPVIRKRVIDSITNLQDASLQVVPRGQLIVGKKANILDGKRKRKNTKAEAKVKPPKKKTRNKSMRAKFGLKPGDTVSVMAEAFDRKEPGSYSKQNSGRGVGIVKEVWFTIGIRRWFKVSSQV